MTDRNIKKSTEIVSKLKEQGIRVEVDNSDEPISKKVRDAQLEKVNYMITIGDKEEKAGTLAVRSREGKVKFGVKLNDFLKDLKKEIEEKL